MNLLRPDERRESVFSLNVNFVPFRCDTSRLANEIVDDTEVKKMVQLLYFRSSEYRSYSQPMWCFCEILILVYNFFAMFSFFRSLRKSNLSKLGWVSIEWKRKKAKRLRCKEKTLTKSSLVARNVMSEGPLRFSGSIMRFDTKTALTNTPRTLHSVSWVNQYAPCL